jgi:hypothetical protein
MRITDVSNNGNTWRYDFTLDGFENTTVNEPSSIAMLAISVLMLVVALRTRARKELKQITRG